MKEIEVSVCIITYRHEKYIRQALDSVFMQKTNFDFEVIVGEDASPDNTRDILLEYKEKYGDKLVLVLHDENVGVSKNARSVYSKVRGKYIATVEGDDFWTDEDKLQKQYDLLDKNPQYSAVCCNYMSVTPTGDIRRKAALKMKTDCVKTMKDWLSEGYSVHTCTIFRRNIFPETEEKYVKLKTAEPTMGDLITFTLLYDAGDIYVLKDVMAAHREAGVNDISSFSYNEKNKAIEHTHMFMRIIRNLEQYMNYKYDLTPRLCFRIAVLKIEKMRGNVHYKAAEMREIMRKLSLKMRLLVHYKMLVIILKKCRMKLRSYYAR